MKKIYFLLIALCLFTAVNSQIVTIPNANFKAKLLLASSSNTIAKDLAGNYFKIDANSDNEIDVNEALSVSWLNVSASAISSVTGIQYFTNLVSFDCNSNSIASLNMSSNTALTILNCNSNPIASLNMSSNTALTTLYCNSNQQTSLNLSGNTALTYLDCSYNQLTSLNLSSNIALTTLSCNSNQLTSLNVTNNTSLSRIYCFGTRLTSLDLSSNRALTYLDCHINQLTSLDLSSNTALIYLDCSINQLTSLNVSSSTVLASLDCSENQLTSLNLSSNIALTTLSCNSNQLTSLNVSSNTALISLYCYFNPLTSLNVSSNTALISLRCSSNQLTNLNVSSNIALTYLECFNNQLTNLNVSSNTVLTTLNCGSNQLTSLNVSSNTGLTTLSCGSNQLTSLYIKNGKNETINFSQNPNLQYICADEGQFVDIQNKITTYGYTNCHTNSYCTFSPGGTFYTIRREAKLDINDNGCDTLDVIVPNLKLNFSNGMNSGGLISDSFGNYKYDVQSGTHTITPIFENPTYFTISPTTANVTFPAHASPFTQNFCVTANGIHPDLEVAILPIIGARPGFDATYKVVYKNKGNTTQSGTVNLIFDDAVLDFVASNPITTSQIANNLSWDFTNLLPFETKEIVLTVNVNSPLETPAVNEDDVLNYAATVTTPAIDDLPNDNNFVFNQTVVNSLDPNDKTCLEGETITSTKVGDYVHYMIRFENNGTANAQNIVVKDIIDTAKFDVNSLIPMKGSHLFVTNITSVNKVEFIFENINLPFDDANNDGYVIFKIKTKPTLVIGNVFSNTASIYFDYNFPIVTNTAATAITALSRQDFVFSNYFSVYPNPVHDVLNISAKESIEVSSINIYNTLGQLVLVIPNAQNTKTVDVSALTTGNYFIKINSDKGTSNTKFIKN
jgi:Leucine-rich repeat (LRR) protein